MRGMDAFLGLNGAGNATPICMLPGLSMRLPEMFTQVNGDGINAASLNCYGRCMLFQGHEGGNEGMVLLDDHDNQSITCLNGRPFGYVIDFYGKSFQEVVF